MHPKEDKSFVAHWELLVFNLSSRLFVLQHEVRSAYPYPYDLRPFEIYDWYLPGIWTIYTCVYLCVTDCGEGNTVRYTPERHSPEGVRYCPKLRSTTHLLHVTARLAGCTCPQRMNKVLKKNILHVRLST